MDENREIVNQEEKKTSGWKNVVIVVLAIVVLFLGIYVAYDKVLKKDSNEIS